MTYLVDVPFYLQRGIKILKARHFECNGKYNIIIQHYMNKIAGLTSDTYLQKIRVHCKKNSQVRLKFVNDVP